MWTAAQSADRIFLLLAEWEREHLGYCVAEHSQLTEVYCAAGGVHKLRLAPGACFPAAHGGCFGNKFLLRRRVLRFKNGSALFDSLDWLFF